MLFLRPHFEARTESGILNDNEYAGFKNYKEGERKKSPLLPRYHFTTYIIKKTQNVMIMWKGLKVFVKTVPFLKEAKKAKEYYFTSWWPL